MKITEQDIRRICAEQGSPNPSSTLLSLIFAVCRAKSQASAAQLAEANRKLAEVAKDREQVAEAERERIIQLHRDMIDASISRVEFKERYGVEFSSDFAGMVHSLGPTLAIDEIRREVLKEVGGAEHVEALHELYGLLSMQGPIDSFTVKEILVKIQVTDTRPPIDIQRIKSCHEGGGPWVRTRM